MEEKLPKALRPTRVLMYVQGGLGILGNLLILVLLAAVDDEGAGLLIALTVVGVVLAAVILVAAAMMHRRPPWVRPTVLTVEAIVVANGVINLIAGLSAGAFSPMMLLPLVFGVLVIQALTRQEARDWFAGQPV
ncbi:MULTISPECIES: hypothetical protein [Actinokineospora]|nr:MULTISPECIES: hypothetical protein [Actinokineospora]